MVPVIQINQAKISLVRLPSKITEEDASAIQVPTSLLYKEIRELVKCEATDHKGIGI
jgi:hypothetical protein